MAVPGGVADYRLKSADKRLVLPATRISKATAAPVSVPCTITSAPDGTKRTSPRAGEGGGAAEDEGLLADQQHFGIGR